MEQVLSNAGTAGLKNAVAEIQAHVEDCLLSSEERKRLDESLEELEKGESSTLEEFEREKNNE